MVIAYQHILGYFKDKASPIKKKNIYRLSINIKMGSLVKMKC